MQIMVTGNHTTISPALHKRIQTKLQKLARHYNNITNVHVVVSSNKKQRRAEATVHLGGNEIFATATADDAFAAVDQLTDKLDRQVVKHKEKLTNHRGN